MEIYNHCANCELGKGSAVIYWDALLEQRTSFLGFAVDDAHFSSGEEFWQGGWVMVNALSCTRESILQALKSGNYYSTQGPRFESIRLQNDKIVVETSPVCITRLIGPRSNGRRIVSAAATHSEFELPSDWSYLRLEIEDENGKLAWTNALFDGPPEQPMGSGALHLREGRRPLK